MSPIRTLAKPSRLAFSIFLAGLLFAGFSLPALAGNMSVYPLRAVMDGSRTSEVLTLRNLDKKPMLVQPTVVRWTQKDGKDVHEPTRDILISPALVEIQPGESQVVRLALRRAQEAGEELSYRVLLKEVPRTSSASGATLEIAMNISLPVFVLPKAGSAKPLLELTDARPEATGKSEGLRVTLRNSGNAHVQVTKFALRESSSPLGEYNSMFYILPGNSSTIRIPLARKPNSHSVRFDAQTDAGTIGQEFRLP